MSYSSCYDVFIHRGRKSNARPAGSIFIGEIMEYEIVELNEKWVCGVADKTNNSSPEMGAKIGALWQKLYGTMAQTMKGRVNGKAVGLYCDYGKSLEDDYTVLVGCEVESENAAKTNTAAEGGSTSGSAYRHIPAGRYAKFTLRGDVVKAVGETWREIWNTPLERTFTGDFEEYQEDCDGKTGTIFIYIAVK